MSRRAMTMEATRAALLRAGRRQFAEQGYAAAELSRIVADAGVTTGAVYHHFGSKLGLFTAVAEDLEVEILVAAASVAEDDPWLRLTRSFEVLIDVCATPAVQRITFVEAPQVIGPEAWRAIELRYAYGACEAALAALKAAGIVGDYPPDLMARLLLALLRESAAEVAKAPQDAQVRARVSALASRVLEAFRLNVATAEP